MLTVSPSEPTGQVPIGGLPSMPTAKAGMASPDGSTAPPARPALAHSKLRRDTGFWNFRDMSFLLWCVRATLDLFLDVVVRVVLWPLFARSRAKSTSCRTFPYPTQRS